MRRDELQELHNIQPISNMRSILERGILCNRRAAKIPHTSVAMEEIQDRRRVVVVPGGLPLHNYANLYFNARNKMMYKLRRTIGCQSLCVLRLDPAVLDLEGTVIADQNASSTYARFFPSPGGLSFIERDRIFAGSWLHNDQRDTWRHAAEMCAEVLIPDFVAAGFIVGAYVISDNSRRALSDETDADLPVTVQSGIFFG
jgi:hypothetical protein